MKTVSLHHGTLPPGLNHRLSDIEQLFAARQTHILSAVTQGSNNPLQAFKQRQLKRAVCLIEAEHKQYILKLFFLGNLPRRLFYRIFKGDPMRRAYTMHQQLQILSPSTPHAYCCGTIPTACCSFLILEPLTGVQPIAELIIPLISNPNSIAAHRLVRWIAIETAYMHQTGFFHGDIKPSHLYVDTSTATTESFGSFVWIDLDRACFTKRLSTRARINNLYHLVRYCIAPLGWSFVAPFLETYRAYAPDCKLSREVLLANVIAAYQTRTWILAKRTTKRLSDGRLSEEDLLPDNNEPALTKSVGQ